MITSRFLVTLIMMLTLISPVLLAAEEGEVSKDGAVKEPKKEPMMYYEIEPNILTFYQGTGRKLGYVVVQVNVAVRGQDNFDTVEENLPLLQDNLIAFFNAQDKSVIQPIAKRDDLRLRALESANTALEAEIGEKIIENLLFTNYVYQ